MYLPQTPRARNSYNPACLGIGRLLFQIIFNGTQSNPPNSLALSATLRCSTIVSTCMNAYQLTIDQFDGQRLAGRTPCWHTKGEKSQILHSLLGYIVLNDTIILPADGLNCLTDFHCSAIFEWHLAQGLSHTPGDCRSYSILCGEVER